ncbi:MAG: hypothetical protein WAX80_03000, partial [Minisyncoccia bacterium]
SLTLPANPGAGETVSYDKEGHIERFPLSKKLFLPVTIILVAVLSFGIGRLSVVGEREAIRIEYDQELTTNDLQPTTNTSQTASVINSIKKPAPLEASKLSNGVVGSKNGTKYHYSYCSGAKQIKEENKIVFSSPEVAQAAGYTLAANCKPK